MTENQRKPVIRFAEFTDAWEQRELGDLAKRTYGGGTPNTMKPEYWNGDIPWIQSSNLTETSFSASICKHVSHAGIVNSATQIIPKNSIAIVTHVGVGKLSIMPMEYCASQDFISLSDLCGDSYFLAVSFQKKLQSDLAIVQGSAIKGITKNDLLSKIIFTPNINEQKKIGKLFSDLDNLITLHQREYDKTLNIKKAMLEKMFPKNGEDRPEIRFAGFTDAWEQRKLGNLCKIIKGRGLSKDSVREGESKKCILYGHLYTEYGMFIKNIKYGSLINQNNPVYSEIGDVLIPSSDTTPYGCARAASISESGVILGGDINVIRPPKYINGDFLSLTLNHERLAMIQIIRGTTVRHLNGSDLSNLCVHISTNKTEQSKISAIFLHLDDLITLHQRELKKLQNMKKALLEKMFVQG